MSVFLRIPIGILSSLPSGLLLSLVFLALLRLVLEDKAAQFQAQIDIRALATSLAVEQDTTILDDHIGFRILALLAKNKFIDESVQIVLELRGLVGTIDDPAVVGRIG